MGKLLGYLKKFLPGIVPVLICAAASTIFSIFGPKILGQATTKLFEGLLAMLTGTGGIDFTAIAQILLFLAALYLISALLSYVQGWVMAGVATKLSYNMRKDISEKIDRMPLSYFDRVSNGEVLSRITNDVDTITQTLNQSLSQIVTNVTMMVGVLCMMLSISPLMTLVVLCILPLSVLIVTQVVKRSQPFFRKQQEYLGHVNGHVEEMYGSHLIVTAFNGQEDSIEEFKKAQRQPLPCGVEEPVHLQHHAAADELCEQFGVCGYLCAGRFFDPERFHHGGRYPGVHPVCAQLYPAHHPDRKHLQRFADDSSSGREGLCLLEEEEETADPQPSLPAENIDGSVYFAHVHFGYVPEKTIINDFSAIIQPGTKVAIVGPTGAGKTTMVKLLMRFYDVSGGAILLNGYDVKQFSRSTLRDSFGMVLQDTWLYNDTIRENIRFGRLDATDEEVVAAAKAAQVDHFVRTLPHGYDTVLNEEASNISQGQKQLLTIARTIISIRRF